MVPLFFRSDRISSVEELPPNEDYGQNILVSRLHNDGKDWQLVVRYNIRIDLIGSIPSNHVHDSFISAGMIFEPWIDPENSLLDNYDSVLLSNQ